MGFKPVTTGLLDQCSATHTCTMPHTHTHTHTQNQCCMCTGPVHVHCIVQVPIHKIGYMKYDNYFKIGEHDVRQYIRVHVAWS